MKQPKKPTKQNNCVRIYPEIKKKIVKKFGSVQKFLEEMIKLNLFLAMILFTSCGTTGKKLFGSKELADKAEAKVVKKALMKESLVYGFKLEDWIKEFGQPEQMVLKGDYMVMQYRKKNFGPDELVYVAFHKESKELHQWEIAKDVSQQASWVAGMEGFNQGIQGINQRNEQRVQDRQEYLDNFYKESARKREMQEMKKTTCTTRNGFNNDLITECR